LTNPRRFLMLCRYLDLLILGRFQYADLQCGQISGVSLLLGTQRCLHLEHS